MTTSPLMEKTPPKEIIVIEEEEDNDTTTTCFPRIRKSENRKSFEAPRGKFSFLPNRKPVDINFKGLTYAVKDNTPSG